MVLALVVCVAGCGKGTDPIQSNPELDAINNVVVLAGDTDSDSWAELFVEGAAPADSKPYGDHIFTLPAEPNVNISGDTAEIEVLVLTEIPDMDGDGVPDEQEDTVTWTAQKIGEKWKLKTAPLP
jgi:hypothetical protein